MKRIVQLAVVALACSAGAAWAQQDQQTQAQGSGESVAVAQAGPASEGSAVSRGEAQSGKLSFHEMTGLAGDGYIPSRGGPLDD